MFFTEFTTEFTVQYSTIHKLMSTEFTVQYSTQVKYSEVCRNYEGTT